MVTGGGAAAQQLMSAFGSPPPTGATAVTTQHSLNELAHTANSLLFALHQSSQSNAVQAANSILVSFLRHFPS
jgi:hypothetical protein